jgi:hypothetical protein
MSLRTGRGALRLRNPTRAAIRRATAASAAARAVREPVFTDDIPF